MDSNKLGKSEKKSDKIRLFVTMDKLNGSISADELSVFLKMPELINDGFLEWLEDQYGEDVKPMINEFFDLMENNNIKATM